MPRVRASCIDRQVNNLLKVYYLWLPFLRLEYLDAKLYSSQVFPSLRDPTTRLPERVSLSRNARLHSQSR